MRFQTIATEVIYQEKNYFVISTVCFYGIFFDERVEVKYSDSFIWRFQKKAVIDTRVSGYAVGPSRMYCQRPIERLCALTSIIFASWEPAMRNGIIIPSKKRDMCALFFVVTKLYTFFFRDVLYWNKLWSITWAVVIWASPTWDNVISTSVVNLQAKNLTKRKKVKQDVFFHFWWI